VNSHERDKDRQRLRAEKHAAASSPYGDVPGKVTRSSLLRHPEHPIAAAIGRLPADDGATLASAQDAEPRIDGDDRTVFRGRGFARIPIPADILPGKLSVSALMRRQQVGELGPADTLYVVENLAPGKMSLSSFLRRPEVPIDSTLAGSGAATPSIVFGVDVK